MIKNIIFDFGDIFINLDKKASNYELKNIGAEILPEEMLNTCFLLETGKISKEKFINIFVGKYFSEIEGESIEDKNINFLNIWNSILLDFPIKRLIFLQELAKSKKYRLFLLSNTNELHISWIKNNWGLKLFNDFKNCFEQFYLSHEIHLRKPNNDIFEFVLNKNKLSPKETLFIDDVIENTEAASLLGIHVWNLNPQKEDVSELFTKNKHLF